MLGGGGTAYGRIEAYLLRERDVLRGCPLGRLAMDPDVVADAALRAPVDETLDWLRDRLAGVVQEGVDRGEFAPGLDRAAHARPSRRWCRAVTCWPARPARRRRSTRRCAGCSTCSPPGARRGGGQPGEYARTGAADAAGDEGDA